MARAFITCEKLKVIRSFNFDIFQKQLYQKKVYKNVTLKADIINKKVYAVQENIYEIKQQLKYISHFLFFILYNICGNAVCSPLQNIQQIELLLLNQKNNQNLENITLKLNTIVNENTVKYSLSILMEFARSGSAQCLMQNNSS
eukprot:TRINITY_DN8382_c1_g1_i3.p3 TRINITY_DN8382_c1_g1~~TRINITY_DN8382_c1_g1_i3.p3  ORF type:complete len:144 (-),score=5.32 TRINITY_DN8382_c1_g1_i3:849-1280(-)